ncbi:MAG: PAS domain-containing protein, partial [Oceanidesulfovibrio sp.]
MATTHARPRGLTARLIRGVLRYFERMKFRSKIALGISTIVLLMAVIFAVTLGEMASRAVLSEGRKRGRTVAENLAMRAAEPLIASDFLRLKNLVDEVKKVSLDIVYAFIMDKNGHVLTHTFQQGFPVDLITVNPTSDDSFSLVIVDTGSGYIYDFAAPVRLAGSGLGTVRLGLSREQLLEPVSRLNLAVFAIATVSLLVALLAGLAFSHRVTRRINILKQHAESVVMGNLEVQSAPEPQRHCWECMNCKLTNCPAYGDSLRRCWYMAGHLDDNVPDECVESCRDCVIYRQNAGDEIQNLAEAFDVMSVTLNTHIKELRSAESNLRRQQQLLRTIMDVTPDFLALFDNNLRYISVNKAFAEFVHLPETEIIGKTDEDLFPADDARRRATEARLALESNQVRKAEIAQSGDGGERWFHVVWTPVRDSEDRIVGLLRTSRD